MKNFFLIFAIGILLTSCCMNKKCDACDSSGYVFIIFNSDTLQNGFPVGVIDSMYLEQKYDNDTVFRIIDYYYANKQFTIANFKNEAGYILKIRNTNDTTINYTITDIYTSRGTKKSCCDCGVVTEIKMKINNQDYKLNDFETIVLSK